LVVAKLPKAAPPITPLSKWMGRYSHWWWPSFQKQHHQLRLWVSGLVTMGMVIGGGHASKSSTTNDTSGYLSKAHSSGR